MIFQHTFPQEVDMKTWRAIVLFVLLCTVPVVLGCGGGGAKVQASSTTMGQELQDIKKARDEGIISQEEYEDAKEEILERYN